MKVYKLILTGSLLLTGYMGYNNFSDIESVISPNKSIKESKVYKSAPEARSAARARLEEKGELKNGSDIDYVDLGIKIGETILPLLAPVLIRKRRKTLDNEIADVADQLGLPKSVVRGKLGLGNRRKAQSGIKKRRTKD